MTSKKLLFSILFLLMVDATCAQRPQLWGMNSDGGIPSGNQVAAGNIYTINSNDSNFMQRHCFVNTYPGANPYGSVMKASNGKLYGMTSAGGGGSGVLFSFDTSTDTYAKLLNFDDGTNDAQSPIGNLIQAGNGKLYGMSLYGGSAGAGVLFSFDLALDTFVKLVDFDDGSNDAQTPFGSLVEAGNGKLYGTANGGTAGSGVLFSFDPSSNTYTKHINFNTGSNDASSPSGSLMLAGNGKLYGMTTSGGVNNLGVLFSFDPSLNTYAKLHDFDDINGANPSFGNLLEGASNVLYGMTNSGGIDSLGVLFSYNILSTTFSKLIDFDGATKGASPYGSMRVANNGKLYGMTSAGGAFDLGVAFSYDPGSSTFTKLVDFNGKLNGSNPWADMMQAANGKLYGMTNAGGSGIGYYGSTGVLFSYDIATDTYAKRFDFNVGFDGNSPAGKMTRATNGKLYGTSNGGSIGYGVLFSLNTTTNAYSKEHEFDFTNGADPTGSLVQASNGKFYGTATGGGANNFGVLFSFDPSSNTYAKLVDFNDSLNGSLANGGLIQAGNGLLYGMTNAGGDSSYGVLYSFDPSSNNYVKLLDFDGRAKGSKPLGSLVQASNGKLFGLTSTGGIYDNSSVPGAVGTGVLFSYDPSSSAYVKHHDFGDETLNDGAYLEGSLLKSSSGMLYGITTSGGITGAGNMFEYDPSSDAYSILLDFDGIFVRPWGDLIQASNGNIYGATSDTYIGSMFEFDPVGATFSFGTTNTGGLPSLSTAFVEVPTSVLINEVLNNKGEFNVYPNPSTGKITVAFTSKAAGSSLTICNPLGQEVYSEKQVELKTANEVTLHLPSGIYFVQVNDGKEQVTQKLVIRQ